VGLLASTENVTNYQNDFESNFSDLLMAGVHQVAKAKSSRSPRALADLSSVNR
jgi:hypothetical protein